MDAVTNCLGHVILSAAKEQGHVILSADTVGEPIDRTNRERAGDHVMLSAPPIEDSQQQRDG